MNSHIDIAGRKLSDLPRVFMQLVWAELIERLVEDKAVGAKRIRDVCSSLIPLGPRPCFRTKT
jgi:hypothetical protein